MTHSHRPPLAQAPRPSAPGGPRGGGRAWLLAGALVWALAGLSACEEPEGAHLTVRPHPHLQLGPVGPSASPNSGDSGAVAQPGASDPAAGASPSGPPAHEAQASVSPSPSPTATPMPALGPGVPVAGPWAVIHGSADEQPDLAAIAETYRLIVVDADPALGHFSAQQIATLRAGGRNRVLSYLNLGSIEVGRSYWTTAPDGLSAAQDLNNLGPYSGYPRERWMDFADEGWHRLVLQHVAPSLMAQGVDGFFLDNLELLEHPAFGSNGPCDAGCKEGGMRLVAQLRAAFPKAILINQGAIAQATLEAQLDGVPFPSLFDGLARESVFTHATSTGSAAQAVYRQQTSQEALALLRAWKALPLKPGGHPFWLGVLEYANRCQNLSLARQASDLARAEGFSPALGDRSAGLRTPCAWPPELLAPP